MEGGTKYTNIHKKASNEWRALLRAQPTMCHSLQEQLYATALKHPSKNRYPDVLANENTRVVLKQSSNEDGYINANFVNSNYARYVSCQGPLPHTFDDFWSMIWETEANVIVMLTRLIEKRRVKSHCYWPTEECESQNFNGIQVTLKSCAETETITQIHLEITKGEETRQLLHLHYTGWPDFGVPTSTEPIIRIYEIMDTFRSKYGNSPKQAVVVHCSAGIGRSGTFLGIQFAREHMKNKGEMCSIKDIVTLLREQRWGMVQTKEQYKFIYRVLEDMHLINAPSPSNAGKDSPVSSSGVIPAQMSDIRGRKHGPASVFRPPVVRAAPNGRKALTKASSLIRVGGNDSLYTINVN